MLGSKNIKLKLHRMTLVSMICLLCRIPNFILTHHFIFNIADFLKFLKSVLLFYTMELSKCSSLCFFGFLFFYQPRVTVFTTFLANNSMTVSLSSAPVAAVPTLETSKCIQIYVTPRGSTSRNPVGISHFSGPQASLCSSCVHA